MKILLITEKCSPKETHRDGGARLVETFKRAFHDSLSIMQFGLNTDSSATWSFEYPFDLPNRFERRLANANFIAEQVKAVEQNFTHVIFVHISMQFGLVNLSLRDGIDVWTFPMFLTPSYVASGEVVPEDYLKIEHLTLTNSKNILTPSHLEKRQMIEYYSIPEERIHVVPRGVNAKLVIPKVRFFNEPPKFCSIGSIKSQKNTLGLIRLFEKIINKYPGSTLKIIGAVQDSKYYAKVVDEIERLKFNEIVELTGYIMPNKLPSAIEDAHLHLSASTYETFGRSIFETLASGLPNIAKATGNAAAEFLENLPYVCFVDDDNEALKAVEEMLINLPKLSSMALEIGKLYDEEMLSQLLVAKICNKERIAISDFDGTLFHKNDHERTLRCIETFRNFPIRVICSARPIHDLLDKLRSYSLEVDWIVGCSGSIVTKGCGKLLWLTPLGLNDVVELEALIPQAKRIEAEGETLQIAIPLELLPKIFGLRVEIYQGIAFIANWEASKLRAVQQLLRYINWTGQVCAFGDGAYDIEILRYFDGVLVTSSNDNNLKKREIGNV